MHQFAVKSEMEWPACPGELSWNWPLPFKQQSYGKLICLHWFDKIWGIWVRRNCLDLGLKEVKLTTTSLLDSILQGTVRTGIFWLHGISAVKYLYCALHVLQCNVVTRRGIMPLHRVTLEGPHPLHSESAPHCGCLRGSVHCGVHPPSTSWLAESPGMDVRWWTGKVKLAV